MTRIGFYIIHNHRYRMICSIDVPWNFAVNMEDESLEQESGPIISPDFEEIPDFDSENSESTDEESGIMPLQEEEEYEETFEEWFKRYYNEVLSKDSNFMSNFNNDRTYFIISQEKEDVMGIINIHKGWVYINLEEFDYRKIINSLYPTIREDMTFKDESFGGYDDDPQFSQEPERPPLPPDIDVCNKPDGRPPYPNLIYHNCINHFKNCHYHR